MPVFSFPGIASTPEREACKKEMWEEPSQVLERGNLRPISKSNQSDFKAQTITHVQMLTGSPPPKLQTWVAQNLLCIMTEADGSGK